MVGESKKMKISISIEGGEYGFLNSLVESKEAANHSHAVRICIEKYRKMREEVK